MASTNKNLLTLEQLQAREYKIENAQISHPDLSMADHGCLVFDMELAGCGWGCAYGGYAIGKGYLGADNFTGSAKGLEYIMRIMDTAGVERMQDLDGKYIRVASKGWGSTINIIGNIIEDKWFDAKEFFATEE